MLILKAAIGVALLIGPVKPDENYSSPTQDVCASVTRSKPGDARDAGESYAVDSVTGVARISIFPGAEDTNPAKGLCVWLFASDGSEVAVTVTGKRGEFEIGNIYPGRYRLIAASKAIHELNIGLEVKAKPSENGARRNRLLLHFRLRNDRIKSWASLASERELNEKANQ